MRATYHSLMQDPAKLEAMLLAGARKARALTIPFMASLRHAVGLRNLAVVPEKKSKKANKNAVANFKQYRESDGRFYFKLVSPDGVLLLQSKGFDSPKIAGQSIATLRDRGMAALESLKGQVEPPPDTPALAQALTELAPIED